MRLQANYADADHQRTQARRAWWRERQRAHRKYAHLRPAAILPRETDPLELAEKAVRLTEQVIAASAPPEKIQLETVAEIIRRLAWGPVK
ncbi:MAG: hypothetical protein WDA71_13515 [Actinomycetota bacterium]